MVGPLTVCLGLGIDREVPLLSHELCIATLAAVSKSLRSGSHIAGIDYLLTTRPQHTRS